MNNQCEQFERILEQQDEDGLPKSVLAHMESCEVCRALSEDFTAIHDMALEIGHEGVAPPERVWISLRNQLEAEGLIKDSTDDAPVETPLKPGWWSAFQRPALAGAFLGVMLAAAATAGYLSNFAPKVAQLEFTHPQ